MIKYHISYSITFKYIHRGENILIVVQAVEMVPKQEKEPVLAESVHVQQIKILFKQKIAMKEVVSPTPVAKFSGTINK